MANIISPICFSNANNDFINKGSDFKVSACELRTQPTVFFFKLRRAALRRAGAPPSRQPDVFPQDEAQRC